MGWSASALLWFKLTHFNSGNIRAMKLTHLVLASTISAFALISTGASAQTYHFGEGQSSMSGTGGASRHAPPPKHRKHKKTRHTADKGAYSQP
jgi:hypothetical protein